MPPNNDIPLYLNWSFWAVVVAAIALTLSQLPPVYKLIRRAKLSLELYSRIHVNHKVGNPTLQLHIILMNVGGRSVRVKGLMVKLKRDGNDVVTLPAQGYLQETTYTNAVLFTGFRLKSKEEWAHMVNFFNVFSRLDEKKYRDAELALKSDIIEKRKILENKDKLIMEADPKYVPAFEKMFEEKFIWLPGEYELEISVITVNPKVDAKQKYRFTLFESDSTDLSKVKAEFKSGDSIFWDSGNHAGVIVQIAKV